MTATLLNERYRIIDVLSSGGFCKTFLAEDTQMPSGRCCVIKQLKPITNNPQYQLVQRRFQREAAILEELGGASNQIPTLYAYFQTADQFYLVQEWISGQTLNQIVQQSGCLSESEVHSILISLLNVLEYLHGKGIIHRDIKPNNIILRSSDDKPVLIDFGAVRETMATVVNNGGIVTSSIIVGTPGFMPNEQVAGRPVFASDLYSLGLTAIYLLTGKLPQELPTDSYTGEIIWERDAVSPNMSSVLHKATLLNIRERYPTAKAMRDALQRITNLIPASMPTFIQPPPQVPATIKSADQSRGQNGIFLGGSLIAGGLVGASIIISLLLTKSPQPVTYRNSSSLVSKPQVSQSPNRSVTTRPKIVPSSQLTITNSANLPSSFHFIADSTEPNLQPAIQQIKRLQAVGYRQPGVFWIPDYPNLSEQQLFVVYVATFSDRNGCIDFLKTYGQVNSNAYCALASKDPNAPPDHVYFKQVSTISKPDTTSTLLVATKTVKKDSRL